jgi:tripartite-type tricarboxylate transporter receptor subunit TctC
VLVPAGTPKHIVARLHADIVKAIASPDMRDRMNAIGLEPVGNTPEQFAGQIRSDIARWGAVIRQAGIKVD